MRGSAKQIAPGKWRLTYDVPPPPGKPRAQRRETYHGNQKGAHKRLNELVGEVQKGTYIPPVTLTTGQYCTKWLGGSVKNTVAPTTLNRYERIVRLHIVPGIGHIPLQTLHPQQVQDWYNSLDYKPNTIKCIHSVLHRALSQAVLLKVLPHNPSDGVELPRCSLSKVAVLREADIKALIEAAKGSQYYLAVVLAAYTGMRAGEVCGLRWQDVDLDNKMLKVTQTAAILDRRLIYKVPKTQSSCRVIDLPDAAAAALALEAQYFVPGDYVCPWKPANFYTYLRDLGKKLGIPASPHALRHAHASLLGRLGENVKVISERMGHSNVSTTLRVYTHLVPEQGREAARKLDEVLR